MTGTDSVGAADTTAVYTNLFGFGRSRMVTTRAMTRSQSAHANDDEGPMDFQAPVYIGYQEYPTDVEAFDRVAAVEEEKLPYDDAVSWTEYVSSGDIESPPIVPQDVKLSSVPSDVPSVGVPSVGVPSVRSSSVSSATDSVPQVIDVSTAYDDNSSAAIDSIMSASTTVTRHSTITTASVRYIDIAQRRELVDGYLQRFQIYTNFDRTTREAMILEDELHAAYQESFPSNNRGLIDMVMGEAFRNYIQQYMPNRARDGGQPHYMLRMRGGAARTMTTRLMTAQVRAIQQEQDAFPGEGVQLGGQEQRPREHQEQGGFNSWRAADVRFATSVKDIILANFRNLNTPIKCIGGPLLNARIETLK